MLSHLQLHNYQSHALTRLDLAPGVNAIVGPSDGGKSAVIRAVSWAATNRPAGEGSKRHSSEGGWGVVIKLADGPHVARVRGEPESGGGNHYSLALDEGKARIFEAMGQDVPAEIAAALRLPPLCFQRQMDPPYLLSESAGEFARRLNEVAGLDVLDRAQSNIARAVREEDRRVQDEDEALTRTKADYETLTWVPKAAEILQAAEEAEKALEQRRSRYVAVTQTTKTLAVLTMQLDSLPDWKSIGERLAETDDAASSLVKRRLHVATVRKAIAESDRLHDELCRVTSAIEVNHSAFEKLMPLECPLCGK